VFLLVNHHSLKTEEGLAILQQLQVHLMNQERETLAMNKNKHFFCNKNKNNKIWEIWIIVNEEIQHQIWLFLQKQQQRSVLGC